MFERYTEKARRVIFFARYEASQFGAPAIEPEHLLLGLMREDKTLTGRFFPRAQVNIEAVRKEIEGRTLLREKISTSVELPLAPETKRVLAYAHEESDRLQHRHIGTEHLLLGLLREDRSMAAEILYERGLRLNAVRDEIARQTGADARASQKKDTPHLVEFSRDLTDDAASDKLDPLVGREAEIERVVQILCRRTKNNPVLIGEPGVGKTAIVEGLAQRIVRGEVPSFLENKRILSLDLSLIVAGTKYRGQFEERLKQIMRELIENPHYIVFIDELHTLVGAGSAEGSLDAANILKPALSRGEVQCIGATTPGEFRKSIEKDRSLERRFQAVKVPPPTEIEAVQILDGVRERYETFHQVRYTDDALEAAVYQSSRYIPDRFLPDKAIDVLDEAGARVKLRVRREQGNIEEWNAPFIELPHTSYVGDKPLSSLRMQSADEDALVSAEVTRDDIEDVIARWTGIPITSLKEEETQKLLRIEQELHLRIVSQRPAISALARAIRRSRAGLKNPQRPVGSFLFLGPTGVGKTEVARSLAELLFGSERSMIRFDMSEFMEKHSVSKLIGSPPGYVGHEEGGQLTERIKRSPYSVLLFDEIEKAHPDIFNVLLQVFEDGILTDALGNTVDFKNAIIIMTSNIGARFIQKKGTMGFQATADASREKLEEMVMSSVRQTFNPEFINRLDEIIIFDQLADDELLDVVQLQIEQMNKTLQNRGLEVRLTDEAKRWLVNKTCADRSYGARPLRRALQKHVEDRLSEALIQGHLVEAGLIEVFLDDNDLNYRSAGVEEPGDALLIH
ncbi:MAG: ATP-dependent Clp protease ATP-binding subunit ClpC [Acidobacteriota bacterium]|jgi:ATP-dependent Clp protease ATP-binding subunit ClpC|nr:ATP-dependent Clp protease ATP-binding subunit ClpC [Acidobacteriota bacterium]MDT5061278.1 ATP-dependent Clp protease ATP-binding subunit ClpC [Acidobacteriota bacterium]